LAHCVPLRLKTKTGADETISDDDVDQSKTLPKACEQAWRLTFQTAEPE